jgi:hypothetical protein
MDRLAYTVGPFGAAAPLLLSRPLEHEAASDVAFPARHGRDVGLLGGVAVGLRDLRVVACEEGSFAATRLAAVKPLKRRRRRSSGGNGCRSRSTELDATLDFTASTCTATAMEPGAVACEAAGATMTLCARQSNR